jgi:predicted nucleic acid-binding protein
VEVLPFDLTAARISARLDATLQKAGRRLDVPDLFIAGICVARTIPLLTRNVAHFSRIPQLTILDPHELVSSGA